MSTEFWTQAGNDPMSDKVTRVYEGKTLEEADERYRADKKAAKKEWFYKHKKTISTAKERVTITVVYKYDEDRGARDEGGAGGFYGHAS